MYGYTDTSGVGERVSQVVTNNVSPVRCAVLSEACAPSSASREEGVCDGHVNRNQSASYNIDHRKISLSTVCCVVYQIRNLSQNVACGHKLAAEDINRNAKEGVLSLVTKIQTRANAKKQTHKT